MFSNQSVIEGTAQPQTSQQAKQTELEKKRVTQRDQGQNQFKLRPLALYEKDNLSFIVFFF